MATVISKSSLNIKQQPNYDTAIILIQKHSHQKELQPNADVTSQKRALYNAMVTWLKCCLLSDGLGV